MRIAMAADHNGVELKNRLVELLTSQGHQVEDYAGAVGGDVVDYPPLCAEVGHAVAQGRADRAIVIGGSGQGEAVVCNKIRGIRAGLCHDVWSTTISRANNDSNVLVLGAKVVGPELAEQIVGTWLSTEFSGGVHRRRLAQIAAIERAELS